MTQFQYNPNHQDLPDQQVDAGLAAANCLRLYERAMREIEAGRFEVRPFGLSTSQPVTRSASMPCRSAPALLF